MPPDGFIIPTPFGPYTVHFYGILIMIGVLAAAWLTFREAKRRGENPEFVWDVLPWVLVAGIVGARIWHILTPPASMVAVGITTEYYLTHPLEAIAIWNGGLGIPGAVAGGGLAVYLYARAHHTDFKLWADMVVPGLALAQGIGRWGNFFNQELYGAPSNLPWAIYIDPAHRLPGFQNYAYYQPLFLYESILDVLNMAFLLWIGRRYASKLRTGDLFLIYLVTYPTVRFFLEFLRLDQSPVAGLDINQVLAGVVAVAAAASLYLRHRGRPAVPETPPQEEPEQPENVTEH